MWPMCIILESELVFWLLLVADVVLFWFMIAGIISFRKDIKRYDEFIKNERVLNNNLKNLK